MAAPDLIRSRTSISCSCAEDKLRAELESVSPRSIPAGIQFCPFHCSSLDGSHVLLSPEAGVPSLRSLRGGRSSRGRARWAIGMAALATTILISGCASSGTTRLRATDPRVSRKAPPQNAELPYRFSIDGFDIEV